MYTIGIDLGGTNIVASVVDDEYKIIGTSKTPTNAPRSADEIFDDISEVCEEAVKAANLTMADIDSVGMGTPKKILLPASLTLLKKLLKKSVLIHWAIFQLKLRISLLKIQILIIVTVALPVNILLKFQRNSQRISLKKS